MLLRPFSTSVEAAIARSFLSTLGLRTFVFDEGDQFDTNWPRPAVRLMVAEEDLQQAALALASIPDEEG